MGNGESPRGRSWDGSMLFPFTSWPTSPPHPGNISRVDSPVKEIFINLMSDTLLPQLLKKLQNPYPKPLASEKTLRLDSLFINVVLNQCIRDENYVT